MNARTKVSYILPYNDGDRHRFGVNKLLYNDFEKTLYSAGRDGTIKLWNCENFEENSKPIINIQAHFDWINDIVLHDQICKKIFLFLILK
jgi:WD40 repeat protein